jgi:outer membrane autotransporter protein
VTANANVTATGAGATAIYTYSNQSDPTVTVAPGVVVSGGPGGVGVLFDGPVNLLINNGTVETQDGATGLAVQSLSGGTTVDNAGVLTGSVQLAAGGANLLHNLAGGTLLLGPSIDLGGANGVLRNDGTLALAAPAIGSTLINGSLIQTGSGVLLFRVDRAAGQADQLAIQGSAQLDGIIRPEFVNQGIIVPGSWSNAIVVASGGVASTAVTTPSTAIIGYALSVSGNSLVFNTTTNFAPAGLSAFGQRIGDLIGTIQADGGSPLMEQLVAGLVTIPDVGTLNRAYQAIGGDGVAAVPQATLAATGGAIDIFTDRMDAWRVGGLDGQMPRSALTPQTNIGDPDHPYHLWATMMAAGSTGSADSGQLYGGAAGIDGQVPGRPIFVGGGFTVAQSLVSVSAPSASVNATNYGASVYGVGRIGAGYVSALGYLGGNSSGFDRNLYALGFNLASSVRFGSTVAAGRIEGGYSFPIADTGANVTPYVALQPMQVWQGSASESFGSQGNGLRYGASGITALPAYLGVQFDAKWQPRPDMVFTPFVRLAWMHDFLPNREVSRSFAELPGASFTSTGNPVVSNAAVIRAGTQYKLGKQVSLFASLETQLSGSVNTIGGSFGLQWSW